MIDDQRLFGFKHTLNFSNHIISYHHIEHKFRVSVKFESNIELQAKINIRNSLLPRFGPFETFFQWLKYNNTKVLLLVHTIYIYYFVHKFFNFLSFPQHRPMEDLFFCVILHVYCSFEKVKI